jgi:hypothetical protein
MSLFGMINWIYTWYRPQSDTPAAELARQMTGLFLSGTLNGATTANKASNQRNINSSKTERGTV